MCPDRSRRIGTQDMKRARLIVEANDAVLRLIEVHRMLPPCGRVCYVYSRPRHIRIPLNTLDTEKPTTLCAKSGRAKVAGVESVGRTGLASRSGSLVSDHGATNGSLGRSFSCAVVEPVHRHAEDARQLGEGPGLYPTIAVRRLDPPNVPSAKTGKGVEFTSREAS
jgi:hypothetical protein